MHHMRSNSGLVGPSGSGGRLEAYEAATARIGGGFVIALLLHGAFLIYAYLQVGEDDVRHRLGIDACGLQLANFLKLLY